MNKPNFFIVGTPKAGTTSLYHYLEEHPEIFMSPIKETNYFSYAEINQQDLYYDVEHVSTIEEYLAQFAGVSNEKAIGEASVSYLFYPSVPLKLKQFNPDARIIMVLRNPVDRAFSHYLMDHRLGFVNLPLDKIVNEENRDKLTNLYYQQYISLGYYYEQIKRYLDAFGSEQVKVFLYEDVVSNIDGVVSEIYSFLQVDDNYKPGTDQKHNVFLAPKNSLIGKLYTSKAFRTIARKLFSEKLQNAVKNRFFVKEKKPSLDQDLKNTMHSLFHDDILKTADLLNKDLSHWLK